MTLLFEVPPYLPSCVRCVRNAWVGSLVFLLLCRYGGGALEMSKRVTLFWDPRANLDERRAAKATQRYTHFRDPRAEAEPQKGHPPPAPPSGNGGGRGSRDNRRVTPGNDKLIEKECNNKQDIMLKTKQIYVCGGCGAIIKKPNKKLC